MKIVAVGDTHGKIERIKKEFKLLKPDYMFFTGDYYSDGRNISRALKLEYTGVTGNCDSRGMGPQEEIITLSGKSFLIVHGHQYGVKNNLNRLYYRGQESRADMVVFGHTHIPYCEKVEGMWLLNPGSPAYPRLPGRGSYAIIDLTENGLAPVIIKM